jgi:transposase
MKKTDKEDSLKLAHILEDFNEARLPTVPVPSDQEMFRRKLLAGYRRAQQSRNREINKLHALFLARGITTIVRSNLSTGESRKAAIKVLSGPELAEAEYLVACLDLHEQRIKSLVCQIQEETAGDEEIECLQSIPGVGFLTSFAFASHVAVERFENAGQLSNYLGLVPRVYISGDVVRYGQITKRGNSYLRALLVQASWATVRSFAGGYLKEFYEYLIVEKSKSKKKAIVAVARRLAELMYVMMRDGTEYDLRTFRPQVKPQKMTAEELAELALSA